MIRKFTFILLTLLISYPLLAQFKVIEKSGKKPKWVNSVKEDFLIATGSGSTIDQAKAVALNNVREQIVNSVAQNIKSNTIHNLSETTDGKVMSVLSSFESQTKTKTGKVGFLSGISLSKAEDYYWEKVRNKRTKDEKYYYHILYPFSRLEMNRLVEEYKEKEKAIRDRIDEIAGMVNSFESVEEASGYLAELNKLKNIVEDLDKDKVILTIEKYKNVLSSFEIATLNMDKNYIEIGLLLDGRNIAYRKSPKIKFSCSKIISKTKTKYGWKIKYDSEECYEDDENKLAVNYLINNKWNKTDFYLGQTTDESQLFLSGRVKISTTNTKDSLVISCIVGSKGVDPVLIKGLSLEVEGVPTLEWKNLKITIDEKGTHFVDITVPLDEKAELLKYAGGDMVLNGKLIYSKPGVSASKIYNIYKYPYEVNW